MALPQYRTQGTLATRGAQPRRNADPVLHALGGRYHSAVGLDDLLDLNCGGTKLLRHSREPVGGALLRLPSLARLCQCLSPGSRSVLVWPVRRGLHSLGRVDRCHRPVARRFYGHGSLRLLPDRPFPQTVGRSREADLSTGANAPRSDPRL